MSQQHEDRIRSLAERVRNHEYEVDPEAVADAVVRHVRWEDVPDLAALTESARSARRIWRRPRVPRFRRLASLPARIRPQLSA
jgi:hypothetical protein